MVRGRVRFAAAFLSPLFYVGLALILRKIVGVTWPYWITGIYVFLPLVDKSYPVPIPAIAVGFLLGAGVVCWP